MGSLFFLALFFLAGYANSIEPQPVYDAFGREMSVPRISSSPTAEESAAARAYLDAWQRQQRQGGRNGGLYSSYDFSQGPLPEIQLPQRRQGFPLVDRLTGTTLAQRIDMANRAALRAGRLVDGVNTRLNNAWDRVQQSPRYRRIADSDTMTGLGRRVGQAGQAMLAADEFMGSPVRSATEFAVGRTTDALSRVNDYIRRGWVNHAGASGADRDLAAQGYDAARRVAGTVASVVPIGRAARVAAMATAAREGLGSFARVANTALGSGTISDMVQDAVNDAAVPIAERWARARARHALDRWGRSRVGQRATHLASRAADSVRQSAPYRSAQNAIDRLRNSPLGQSVGRARDALTSSRMADLYRRDPQEWNRLARDRLGAAFEGMAGNTPSPSSGSPRPTNPSSNRQQARTSGTGAPQPWRSGDRRRSRSGNRPSMFAPRTAGAGARRPQRPRSRQQQRQRQQQRPRRRPNSASRQNRSNQRQRNRSRRGGR